MDKELKQKAELSDEELMDMLGGFDVAIEGINIIKVDKLDAKPVLKYGVKPPITKYGIIVTKYGVAPLYSIRPADIK
ncbi:MAG TPA: hypothetical protein PK566_05495 [Pseudobacteroides sp.]|nr:hypothetical protein [Pseudobacteroides sp.]